MTAQIFDQPNALVVFVQGELSKPTTRLKEIHRRTKLPYAWLVALSKGRMKNPSFNRIIFLHEFLTGKKLVFVPARRLGKTEALEDLKNAR